MLGEHGGEANAFRTASTGSNYLNQRDGYLALWNSDYAIGSNCTGSAFAFIPVETALSEAYTELTNSVTAYKSYVGTGLFYYPQSAYDTFTASVPTTTPSDWDSYAAAIEQINAAKDVFLASVNMPETGKKYALKNYNYNTYLYTNNETSLGYNNYAHGNSSLLYKSQVWTLEDGATKGTYKLKNAETGKYISTTISQSAAVEMSTTGGDLTFYPNDGDRAGTTAMGYSGQYQKMHLDGSNNVVGWETAGASSWYFEEVSDEAFKALDLKQYAEYQDIYGILPGSTEGTAYGNAFNTYQNNGKSDCTDVYNALINNITKHHYRFYSYYTGENATPWLGTDVDNSSTYAKTYAEDNTNAGLIWQLEICENGYKLKNCNTGTYLGAVSQGSEAKATMNDYSNGAKFTITKNSSDQFIIKDGNGNQMYNESTGYINAWSAGVRSLWHVVLATDIDVALHAVEGKSYATAYFPFGVSGSTNAKAYVGASTTTGTDGVTYLVVDESTDVKANNGFLLVSDDAAEKTNLTIDDEATTTSVVLTGTNVPVSATADGTYLVFGREDGNLTNVGFFKPKEAKTIPCNRAYIYNASSNAVRLSFGETTGIDDTLVIENGEVKSNAPIFDLTGRRVMNAAKGGVYIQNGKKFIVK